MTLTNHQAEAARLHGVWKDAALALELAITDEAATRAGHQEQDAYDDLVDYVEANGLNYSEWDPRGPEDPDYS